MPNPIDELVAKAITQTSDLSAIIPVLFNGMLEPNLRKRAVLAQSLVVNTDLVGVPGDTIKMPTLPDITAATVLTEGTAITIDKLSAATTVSLVPVGVGRAISITREALDRMLFSGMEEIMDRLAYAMSLYIEPSIAKLALLAAVVPGTANHTTHVYPNGHATGTIVAGDVMSADFLTDQVAALAGADVPPFEDGTYWLFMNPKQYGNFRKDAKVRADIQFAEPGVALRGEIGVWQNVRIFLTTHIQTTNEGAASAVPCYNALLTSPRWAAVAYKRLPAAVVDPTLYDFGRERRFAIHTDIDIELLHADRALTLVTAG